MCVLLTGAVLLFVESRSGVDPKLCCVRNTAALKSYEQHLKKQGNDLVELFSFSENHGLDAEKLARKLASSGSAQVSAASILLSSTGESSYTWLNPEHQPKNVELCAMLRQQFPDKLKFVICPTSKDTQDKWDANKSSLQSIFGDFYNNNVSVWTGFDCKAKSSSCICELMCKETQDTEQKRKKPEKGQFHTGHLLAILAMSACGLVYLLIAKEKDLESKKAEIEQLVAEQKAKEKLQQHLHSENEKLQKDLESKQVSFEQLQRVFGALRREKERLQHDLHSKQTENERLRKQLAKL